MSKPFIIWTLQRTGGTNLARRLFERSGLLEAARAAAAAGAPGAVWLENIDDQWKLHEPFNSGEQGRVFSRVTEQWTAARDRKALDAAMAEICALHLPLKHCVEMVPWEVSEALAEASCKAGYAQLFLYRRNPLNRLLSLHYARMSGTWGPHFRNRSDMNGRIFLDPLPVDELVEHEERCVRRLDKAWQLLKTKGAIALAYEDVYQTKDVKKAARLMLPVLSDLELSRDKNKDRKFISEMVAWGDQGTRKDYSAFIGIEALKMKLGKLRPFSPGPAGPRLEIKPTWQSAGSVLHAAIDDFPERPLPGRSFEIGGVVVLKEPLSPAGKLLIVNGEARQPVKWGISSPVMAKRFSQSPNGANARFRTNGVELRSGEVLELRLDDGLGNESTMFVLKTGAEV